METMEPARFHEVTKHSPLSVRARHEPLDWSHKPHPFKDYVGVSPIPLPEPSPGTDVPALLAVTEARGDRRALGPEEVARILVLGAGVLREKLYPDGERFYFRTYASAGALYPIEVYVACAGIKGIDPGVYHFHPLERTLRRIRDGDVRPYMVRATGGRDSVSRSPATVLLSGIPWRTTWKYHARGYRHLFWDAGMIVANIMALAASGGHAAEVVLGFVDRDLDALLGLDGTSEMTLAAVPLAFDPPDGLAPVAAADQRATPPRHSVRLLSSEQRDYPEIHGVHEATSLTDPAQVGEWAARAQPSTQPEQRIPSTDGVERVIRRRGSSRAFQAAALPKEEVLAILECALRSLSADWAPATVRADLLMHAVTGLDPGAYRLRDLLIEPLSQGDFRDVGRFLCLEQPLGGDGAVTCFLMTDLVATIDRLGARGYRAAQLEAGMIAGRIYLGAYACKFGATGLTFYDDKVRGFFKTPDEVMLVVALGRPDKGLRLM
jgi:SagB-type dehydrogenase family enzyme